MCITRFRAHDACQPQLVLDKHHTTLPTLDRMSKHHSIFGHKPVAHRVTETEAKSTHLEYERTSLVTGVTIDDMMYSMEVSI